MLRLIILTHIVLLKFKDMGTFWDNITYEHGKIFPVNKAFFEPSGVVFSNADLDDDNELLIEHGYKTKMVAAKLFDPDGIERDTSDYFQIVDEDNVKLVNGGELDEGKYLLILQFMYL